MESKLLLVHRIFSVLAVSIDGHLTVVSETPCLMLIFARYRLSPDNGKHTNWMLHLLHELDNQSFRLEFSFLLVSSSMPIWVLIRVHMSLAFICFSYLYSFYNLPQFPRLEPESSTGTWTHISVMVKHVLLELLSL